MRDDDEARYAQAVEYLAALAVRRQSGERIGLDDVIRENPELEGELRELDACIDSLDECLATFRIHHTHEKHPPR